MKARKEIVLSAYLAWITVIDAAILGTFWQIFGIQQHDITIAFSQFLLDSQAMLENCIRLMIFQAIGIFCLGWMIRRPDTPKVHFLGVLLVIFNIVLLILLPGFINADPGIIITRIEHLSQYISDVAVWGVSITDAQLNIAIVWLICALIRNVLLILVRYTWAKAIWHVGGEARIRPRTSLIIKAGAVFHAFSFMLVLLPYGAIPILVCVAPSSISIIALIHETIHVPSRIDTLARDVLVFQPTVALAKREMKWIGIPALVAFISFVFIPFFYAVARFAFLQSNNFGGWSFYLWGGVLASGMLVTGAFRLDSPIYSWVFRAIIKMLVFITMVQIVLNLGFVSDILSWGWFVAIGNLVHGGGLALAPGYETIPHVFVYFWGTAITGVVILLATRRERPACTWKHVAGRVKAFMTAWLAAFKTLVSPRADASRRKRAVPVLVFTVVACAFIASTWGYGVPIVLRPHPSVETRISFWTSGSLIPPAYLDVIETKNNAYNTSSRFFSWGNQFTTRSGGQYLIDIPGAKYTLTCAGYSALLGASEMIAYLQRLVAARITYWFYGGSISMLQPMADLLASTTVNATFKALVNQVVEGFIFDIENGGNYASYNASAMDLEHARRAEVVLFAQSMGKKMGYTTVAYTIGDWLDGDDDVSTLFRIHDFHPPSIQSPVIPPYSMDYFNWMIYRSDQEGPERQLGDPYFSYLHFNEAKAYMDAVAVKYPELGVDTAKDLGISMGVIWNKNGLLFSNTSSGRANLLVELQIANALGISEGVFFYFPNFMNLYTPSDYGLLYDDLHASWEVRIHVNQLVGMLGPPFATLWDIPNVLGTRFFYHAIDCMLDGWFGALVYSMVVMVGAVWIAFIIRRVTHKHRGRQGIDRRATLASTR